MYNLSSAANYFITKDELLIIKDYLFHLFIAPSSRAKELRINS